MPGIPLVLSGTPGAVRSAAPARNEGRGSELRWPPQPKPQATATAPAPAAGPLAGVRVLDLGTILAGPFAGYLLAELGADVIKVEPPAGDPFRRTGFIYNRGMRSIPIDLRVAEGKDIFYDLVRAADVVIDNYRPGVLRRLRIDYDSLAAVNPRIISLSITGFGEGGPLAMQPGFDPILQGMSGMMIAQGGNSEPVFLTVAVNDVTGGVMTVVGACLALYSRAVRGAGQRGRTSLDALAAFMQSGELTQFEGRPAARVGGRDYPGPAPLDRLYATRNGWLRLQARPSDLPALREAGLLAAGDGAREEDLAAQLMSSFSGYDTADVVGRLTALGVPAAAARAVRELADDPDIAAAGLLQGHERASGNPYFMPGRLARFERTQQTAALIAPGLGEHTREILAEAGYAADRVNQLIAAGHVVEGPPLNLETLMGPA
jgi:crotonobetainyl-CoA:carnitine CoA-transferase CaiB-like acyl-CoA transferase